MLTEIEERERLTLKPPEPHGGKKVWKAWGQRRGTVGRSSRALPRRLVFCYLRDLVTVGQVALCKQNVFLKQKQASRVRHDESDVNFLLFILTK